MSEKQTLLFRVENPTVPAQPDGATSHPELVGQWFSPSLNKTVRPEYLRKATQTNERVPQPAPGAQLVIASIPESRLAAYRAANDPRTADMDTEPAEDFLLPRDGSLPMEVVPLDDVLGELTGNQLSTFRNSMEARRRVIAHLGELSAQGAIPELPNAA